MLPKIPLGVAIWLPVGTPASHVRVPGVPASRGSTLLTSHCLPTATGLLETIASTPPQAHIHPHWHPVNPPQTETNLHLKIHLTHLTYGVRQPGAAVPCRAQGTHTLGHGADAAAWHRQDRIQVHGAGLANSLKQEAESMVPTEPAPSSHTGKWKTRELACCDTPPHPGTHYRPSFLLCLTPAGTPTALVSGAPSPVPRTRPGFVAGAPSTAVCE